MHRSWPEDVSLLEKCPHFRGCYEVLLERYPLVHAFCTEDFIKCFLLHFSCTHRSCKGSLALSLLPHTLPSPPPTLPPKSPSPSQTMPPSSLWVRGLYSHSHSRTHKWALCLLLQLRRTSLSPHTRVLNRDAPTLPKL